MDKWDIPSGGRGLSKTLPEFEALSYDYDNLLFPVLLLTAGQILSGFLILVELVVCLVRKILLNTTST